MIHDVEKDPLLPTDNKIQKMPNITIEEPAPLLRPAPKKLS